MNSKIILAVLFAATFSMFIGYAQAGVPPTLLIDDTKEGSVTNTHDNQWGAITSNGKTFAPGVNGVVTIPSETSTFSGDWSSSEGTNGAGTIFFTDPDTGFVSDVVDATWTINPTTHVAHITITATSDSEGSKTPVPKGFTGVPETGKPIQITGLFGDQETGSPVTMPSFIDIQFVSDLETTPVGGSGIQIDTTPLLLAGIQGSALWMIPAIVIAGAGITIFTLRKKKQG